MAVDFQEMVRRAQIVQESYRELNVLDGHKRWEATEYMQGLVGDVGGLMRLVMAKNGYRDFDNLDWKIKHEVADCLWAIMTVARELGIDLESAFMQSMDEQDERIRKLKEQSSQK